LNRESGPTHFDSCHPRVSLDDFAGAIFFIRADRRLPFHADMLAICDRRDSRAGRDGGRLAGGEADLPLSSVG